MRPVFLALRFGVLAVFAVVAALAAFGFQTATGGRALSFGLNE